MNFLEIAETRQSCRKYDPSREVEQEKLDALLRAAQLAPSACNGQPYHLTVCRGEIARSVAVACKDAGLNGFAEQAPIQIVISEQPYTKMAALGAKLKGNDYRSIDIGIVAAYLTAEATAQGLSTCILGWLDDKKIRTLCGLEQAVRLVITVGYAADETIRPKKRKSLDDLVSEV